MHDLKRDDCGATTRGMAYTVFLCGALLAGCSASTGKQFQRDIELALALRQVVVFPESDEVTQVVINDNRSDRDGASSATISDPAKIKQIVTFLNDRDATWEPYKGKSLRRPVGVTINYKDAYQHIGTGDGYLYTRLDGAAWIRELSYREQEHFLTLLEVDDDGNESAEDEADEP